MWLLGARAFQAEGTASEKARKRELDRLEDQQGDQSGWSTVNKVKLGQIDTAEIGGLGTLYCVRDLAISWCERFWRILSRGKAAD